MPDPKPTEMRVDARHNRTRILDIAHDLLAVSSDASLNSIAKAAGVGPGTLYRHFPTREALVLAVYRYDIDRHIASVPGLLGERPPLEALTRWFEDLSALIRIKHGLGDALDATTKDTITQETTGPVLGAITLMLKAGEADGTIRAGLDPADVLLLMSCLWRTPDTAEGREQSRRLLGTISRSLRG
ncbi:TetR/AcrR family transcriptional regulator [Streptomyces polygonati]|uniref:TetR/AcrR family transcriptional regulator n=1 Tax=Streptomyces polygonati TaxID=1617087 RepID=A0ABV8HUK1_9ACTN